LSKIAGTEKTVAIITDDVAKYENLKSTHPNLTIVDAYRAQGGEFDYVIVDHDFSANEATLFDKIKDLNTVLSRAKVGSIIINNNSLSGITITNTARTASFANVPTTISDNTADLADWEKKMHSFLDTLSTPGSGTQPSQPGGGTQPGGGSQPGGGGSPSGGGDGDVSLLDGLLGSDTEPDKGNPISVQTTDEEDDPKRSEPVAIAKGGKAKDSRVTSAVEEDLNIDDDYNPKTTTFSDRCLFVDSIVNKNSALRKQADALSESAVKDEFNSDEQGYQTFLRIFSSAVIAGMEIQDRHRQKLKDSCGSTHNDFIDKVCNA